MSIVKIRAALETALNNITPAISTSFENVKFVPVSGTAYQQVHILFATPNNSEFGARHKELGFMQVKLMYPTSVGTASVAARAELIRSTFARGSTFTNSGVNVIISRTPEVKPGKIEADRYEVPVIIEFYANMN